MFDLTKNLKDASYVLIGLGVIGYQKAAEQGKHVRARLDDQRLQLDKQVVETKMQLTKLATDLEQRFEPVRDAVEGRLDTLRTRLTGATAAA
jgi:DNA anti-recombination protein RmuC